MKKKILIATIGAALALGAGTAAAGGFGHGHGRRGMAGPKGPLGAMTRLLHRLDLTSAQRDQIHAILDAAKPQLQPHVEALRAAREKMRALDPANFDEAQVRAIAQTRAAETTEMAVLAQKVRSQVWAVLTPEQQAEAAKVKAERQERRQRMRDCIQAAGAPPAE